MSRRRVAPLVELDTPSGIMDHQLARFVNIRGVTDILKLPIVYVTVAAWCIMSLSPVPVVSSIGLFAEVLLVVIAVAGLSLLLGGTLPKRPARNTYPVVPKWVADVIPTAKKWTLSRPVLLFVALAVIPYLFA